MEMQEPSDWRRHKNKQKTNKNDRQTERNRQRQTISNRVMELSVTQPIIMQREWAGSHGKDINLIG